MVRPFRHKVKGKDYWYVRIRTGKRDTWRSLGPVGVITKTMANHMAEEISRDLRMGKFAFIQVRVPQFGVFAKEFLEWERDVVKKKSYDRDVQLVANLNSMFETFRLSSITPRDIMDYQEKRLREGRKPATVNRELACLKHIFNVARQRGKFAGENPVTRVKFLEEKNDVTRVLTKEEEKRLLDSCPPYLYPIVLTALNTGMRKTEIINLKWTDVNLQVGHIVLESTTTKGKSRRIIPLNKKVRALLSELKLKSTNPYVFVNSLGTPYKSRHCMDKFLKVCEEAELTDITFHALRHTFATRFMEKGGDFSAVYKILGHKDPKVTMRYQHPEESMRIGVERLCDDEE